MLQNKGIEDQLVIFKNVSTAGGSTQKPLSWAILFLNAILLPNLTHNGPIYNNDHKVIVKINDLNSAYVL